MSHVGGNNMSRLGPTGLTQLLTNIKTWITTKLGNYVTTDTTQTVTGKKLFTASAIQLDNVTSMSGSTMFIDTSASAPRGEFPAKAHRVGRIYIGDGTSYNSAWFIVDPIIDTNRAYYRMVTTNPDNTDSARFSICWDSTKEGVRRRRNISMGDLLPSGASTYNLGESGNAWQDAYINKIHGISDYANLKTNSFNANTTLTHGGSGRRVILAMGAITLTVPAPEEGSWFLIKAVNGLVTLNLASNVTVTGITAGVFSGPIHLQPNESILLCYYSSTIYNATISTIRRSGVVGRTGNVPSENPKHWFKIAENYVTATYRDPFICLRVFESTTGNTIGTLCAHCRINNTVGVVDTSNCYLQWQDAGAGFNLSKYALTTNETSGTGVTISLWCQLTGGYSSLKFEVVTEYGTVDQLGNPEWILTRRRQADGDLAELSDTDFTKIVYSTLTTLKNDTTGKASNVTGTVAIANGGTGATTRLNAIKALTNESVGTPTHFLAITTNYAKAGYTTVAQAKTVLGITGDIVSHNASEFLTSHQSLSSCVKNVVTNSQTIKSTGITRGTAPSSTQTFGIVFTDNNGASIGNVYGQYATNKSTYVGLYAYKGTTTANDDNASVRVGYDASGNACTYAPTPATADNSTQIATTAFVKAQGYLTSHQSLANYVTTNTDQSISGIKSHSKHISILGDYVGNESSTNGRSCLYLKANRDTDGKSGLYVTKFRQNVAQGSMGSSDVVFLSHDILENETRTNAGFVESYSNWEDDVPKGMSICSTIATSNLGTSAKPWTNTYAVNFYENGTALSSKYLTVSAISGGASTSAGNITPVKGTIILGFAESSDVTYSTNFGGVLVAPSGLYYATCVYTTSTSTMAYSKGPSVEGTGTWKLMGGGVSSPGTSTRLLFGLWIKIV